MGDYVKYISICSGICAPTAAWKPLGWEPVAFSEIEPFPSRVLTHHYPDVPNHGDFTAFDWSVYRGKVDLVVAGTPCQAFSVAGHRKSLDDARGNLTLEFLHVIDAIKPRYVVWENVPGVLSTDDNAFGCFLGGLVGGDDPVVFERGWPSAGVVDGPTRAACWRTLDAQYFGLPQRRKRVFVVASTRQGRHPAEILFEWESMRRDYPPSRETGEGVAEAIDDGALFGLELSNQGTGGNVGFHDERHPFRTLGTGGGPGVAQIVGAMPHQSHGGIDTQSALSDYIVPTLTGNGDAHSGFKDEHGLVTVGALCANMGQGNQFAASGQFIAFRQPVETTGHQGDVVVGEGDIFPSLPSQGGNNGGGAGALLSSNAPAIANNLNGNSGRMQIEQTYVPTQMFVRRLMPIECERLQGFPDDFTKIQLRQRKKAKRYDARVSEFLVDVADGPRYKALGNSMAVPVLRWIAERFQG